MPPISIDGSACTRQVTLPGPNHPGSPGGSLYCSPGRPGESLAIERPSVDRSCDRTKPSPGRPQGGQRAG